MLAIGNNMKSKYLVSSLVFVFLLLFALTVDAQIFNRKLRHKHKNLPAYDRQIFYPGISLGINITDFVVHRIPDLHTLDSVYVVEPKILPGFNIAIISDLKLNRYLHVRFIPGLSFSDRYLDYSIYGKNDTTTYRKKVESTLFHFPLSFKFKSQRIRQGNWRAYVLAGGNVTYDLASLRRVKTESGKTPLRLKEINYLYEMGIGFDIYLEYFKLSPEIKVSFGINDLLVRDDSIFTGSIAKLNTKALLFSLHFQ